MTSLLQRLFPQGIQSVVQKQLNRVPEPMRPLLSGAAVTGSMLDLAVLNQLITQLGYSFNLDDWLTQGVAAAILHKQEGQWFFSDEQLQQNILDALSSDEMQEWHERIATAMEKVYLQSPIYAETLAHHWQQADNPQQARFYIRLAGEYAYKQSDYTSAIQLISRALILTPADVHIERYELLLIREEIYSFLGNRDAQKDDLTQLAQTVELLAIGASQNADGYRGEIALRLGVFAEMTGEYSVAVVAANETVRLAEIAEDTNTQAGGNLLWGQVLIRQGKYEEAKEKLALSHQQAGAQYNKVAAHSLRFLGVLAADLGQFEEAKLLYNRALPLYKAIQDKRSESTILNNLSVVAYSQNQLADALHHWEEARQLFQIMGDKEGLARVLSNLSTVSIDIGDYEMGRQYSADALSICRDIDLRFGEAFNLINLSLCSYHLYGEDYTDIYSRAALQLAKEMGSRPLEGMALKDQAYILLHQRSSFKAEEVYQKALTVWEELSQPLQQLEVRAGLARSVMLQGDFEKAQTYIQPVIEYLQSGKTPMGSSRPFYIYLTSYEFLSVMGETYATPLLRQAHEELMVYADKISDKVRRQSFLQNVSEHHKIVNYFVNLIGTS